jgi:hypothetical protein
MRKYWVMSVVAATVGVLAVAGGAFAASEYIITSTHQIKPSVLRQMKGNRGPRGFTGAQGLQGTQGPAGAAGVVPQIKVVHSEALTLQPGQTSYDVDPNNFQATCPAGYVAMGAGFNGPFPPTGGFVEPFGNFVGGFFANTSSVPIGFVQLEATCGAVPGGAVIASARTAQAQYHARLVQAQARLH